MACSLHVLKKVDMQNFYCTNLYWTIYLVLVQFLFTFAQGQGPGVTRQNFTVFEGRPPGTLVGKIQTQSSYTYRFQDEQALFILDSSTGTITTNSVIDRELLDQDVINILVLSSPPSGSQIYPIDIYITVLDVNDNSPKFPKPEVTIEFPEGSNVGDMFLLDTATDLDINQNGNVTNYQIIDRDDDNKFRTVFDPDNFGQTLRIQLISLLDREERASYFLNISVQDNGSPPRFGYLKVNINIKDVNDNPPVFAQSQFVAGINESTPVGTTVIHVEAHDADIGKNGEVSYKLTDDTGQFRIDSKTGEIITTTSPLKCPSRCERSGTIACQPNSCIITVEARDNGVPPLNGRAYVSINVRDENDHAPLMIINYQGTGRGSNFSAVNENAVDGQIIAIVTVNDMDSGLYGNISSFSVVAGNELNHFRISSKLEYRYNIIQVNGDNVLDRERKSMYNFTLKAVDRGSPPKSSVTHLIIKVNDINDHKPQFDSGRYTASLSETLPIGSYVANLIATDADSGINAALTYKIVSGNLQGWFHIDSGSGLVTTASLLDFSVASQITLNISVHDGATVPYFDHTILAVTVFDENTMAPTFEKSALTVEISEDATPPTSLTKVTAIDNDSGLNGTVVYSFSSEVGELYPNRFSLNSQSGEITLQAQLDREVKDMYILKVIAKDKGSNPLSSTVTINVKVLDVNDNIPQFYPLKYYINIDESSLIGTSVVKVTAYDDDLGDNGRIYFSFTQAYPQFSINQNSGLITTSEMLRKTLKSSYTLIIACRDSDTSHQSKNNAVIEISVTDETDVQLTFSKSLYTFSIVENDANVRSVGTVSALGANSYTITDGDQAGVFTMNSGSGQISTVRKLDREEKDQYLLTIVARGNSQYISTRVEITVTDVNDNPPKFLRSSVDVYIFENWAVGQDVYYAKAEDEDAGLNSRLSYYMQSDSDLFQIRGSSGVIYLARNIEESDKSLYSMKVTATDSGSQQKTASAQVNVHIMDVNDHTPVFPKNSYEISLNESLSVNSQFYSLTATDADKGSNAKIMYNIVRGNSQGVFGIFPNGKLYVAKKLDRETQDLYKLIVVARDTGTPTPRSSSVNVTIHILDSNDNRPLFVKTSYHFEVSENLPPGQKIGYIKASDVDVGRNAELSYFLDPARHDFAVDVQTGEVSTLASFDRESLLNETGKEAYQVDAVVYDNGIPALKDSATISVKILDENDNSPIFTESTYYGVFSEDTAIYSPIIKVKAYDLDRDENGAVTYSIIKGNEEERFTIHPTTGQISLNGSVDRETLISYEMVVMALDTGRTHQHSASTTVSLTLQDVNDNTPSFDQTSYEVRIPEDTQVGAEITVTMAASDTDVGVNAALTYALTGTGNDGTFQIDSHTGKLYLAKAVDYEVKAKYQMSVTVTDQGVPRLSSDTRLNVYIDDTNDHRPEFVNIPDVVDVPENNPQFKSVLQISAIDRDSGLNGQVTYRIAVQDPPENAFILQNGKLLAEKSLDRETVPFYKLTLVATDSAIPESSRKSVEKTILIRVTDENDNTPFFTSPSAVLLSYPTQQGKITLLSASDPDSDSNGEVLYTLLNNNDKFDVTSTTGQLYLTQNLPQSPTVYSIRVRASDRASKPRYVETNITIVLHMTSRSGPTFLNLPYTSQVMENSAPGTSVTRVSSSSQNVQYYISGIKSGDLDVHQCFVINVNSGIIRTAGDVDREVVGDTLKLTVLAVDTGPNYPAVSSTQVTLTVLDQNDTPPTFSKSHYDRTLTEDLLPATEVLKLTVTDPDTQGSGMTIRITTGNDDGLFRVDNSGSVKITRKLDRETWSQHRLTMEASDGQNTAYTVVTFTILDTNDNSPTFSESFYSFDIPENSPVGTILARVQATDPDEGGNGTVSYELTSSWARGMFQLDSSTGVITLKNPVDFEVTHLYTVTVKATDQGSPPKSSSVLVYFNVKDVNDNAPMFDPQSYSAEVKEDVAMGTSVLQVFATDVDSELNGQLEYSLVSGDSNGQFGIGKDNGTIYTTSALDRETIETYNLVVMATDKAEPIVDRKSTTATVSIKIKDVNDCHPEFVNPPFMYVKENTPIGDVAFHLTAKDKDIGSSGTIVYSLVTHPAFSIIHSTGEIIVKARLDRETVQNYTLQVTATDQGPQQLSTSLTIIVFVEDENDNPPVFSGTPYLTTCSESLKAGPSILQVTATDRDQGLNGIVRFFIIAGDDNADFSMDPSSGVLRVQKNLDYERVQSYHITVRAEDKGMVPRYSVETITINVIDVNDNIPVFIDSPYSALVRENMMSFPVFVAQLSARDVDSPPYNQVTYGLRDGNSEIFHVNSSTGELTCHKPLDREVTAEYKLIVVAIDSGTRERGIGTVYVRVQDVNDNAPKFDRTSAYVGHVIENNNPQTEILTVTATDLDYGPNADITYKLLNNLDNKFAIIADTGVIMTQARLDREDVSQYDLTVIAEDHGSIPLSASANVTIFITDINDNSPTFERPSYHQTLNRLTSAGQFVIGVTALDKDIGSNGYVEYSLSGQDANKFDIDKDRGIVTSREMLSGSTYRCRVHATDKSNQPLSTSVELTVNVSSVSSGSNPTFQNVDSPITINESLSVGTFVSSVRAISGSGGTIKYAIVGGNINSAFQVHPSTGVINIDGTVDYEITHDFQLWIQAMDSSNPLLSSYAKVIINVNDLNDNAPKFENTVYTVPLKENIQPGAHVIQVLATDADDGKNGQVGYVIASGNVGGAFSINPQTGIITTATSLDREKLDHYVVVIKATDQGDQPHTGSTTVRIQLEDVNDNPPKFSQIFSTQIPEDTPLGSFIIQVTSSDADIGNNAKANYSIEYGQGFETKFAIDAESGNITLIAPLDAEELNKQEVIRIPILVRDGSFHTSGSVSVFVTDVNDQTPKLIPPTDFSIMEHSSINTRVGRLNASDEDVKAPNNQVYFSLKLPSTDFKLDDQTGEITLLSDLSYVYHKSLSEAVNQRELVVIVTDLGTPARSSESIVTISILDANDHAPVFDQKFYVSAVPENSAQGQEIVKVNAKDEKDFGQNAEIEYSIDSGNGSDFFSVNPVSGLVVVGRTLQGKIGQVYTLVITATDKGIQALTDRTTVQLTVTGENSYAPQFVGNVFQVTVPEDSGLGQSVARVEATDNDGTGFNAEITYHINSGNSGEIFSLDKRRGIISVNKQLDFDTVPFHVLNISARDLGLHYKETWVMFTVNLTDVNDNPPVFDRGVYDGYISEGSGIGRVITTVTATDADSGFNAKVNYYFSDVQASLKFIVNQYTGVISTKAALDYETTSTYTLLIIAQNPGNTQMKSTCKVIVHVTSVNEYPPKFVTNEYQFSTKESAPNGTVIGNVQATDKDHGEDGIVYYYLIDGSNNKGFSVNYKSGDIFVSGRPDYESSPKVTLTVLVKNWGSIRGNDFDTCMVHITVEDANDPPEFSLSLYTAEVTENSGAGITVTTVTATDNDHNPNDKRFSYNILAGNKENLFRVDPVSGEIKTTGFGTLDRETVPIYNLTVGAVDTGIPPATGSTLVQIHLKDVNDNGPQFSPPDLTGSVMENSDPGTLILSLSDYTTDPDLPPNKGPYQYYATVNNPLVNIVVNGDVKTTNIRLDRETTPYVNVSVRVLDNGNPTMSSVLRFYIKVLDDNDQAPRPRDLEVQVVLHGNTYPASAIGDVSPLDDDEVGTHTCSVNDGGFNLFYIQTGCKLHLRSNPTLSSYNVSINGSDGKQNVKYITHVRFLRFTDGFLESTVVVRVSSIQAAAFMENKFQNFKKSIEKLDQQKNMHIFHISNLDGSNDILVYIGATDKQGNMVSHDALKQLLNSYQTSIESVADISIGQIGYSVCNPASCNTGECLSRVSVGNPFGYMESTSFVLASPRLEPDYKCNCPPQLTGDRCETPVSPCGQGYCENGGICQDNIQCNCPAGWEGDFCQTDKNECISKPCKNGGTCQNQLGSYTCICKEGFSGINCETGSNSCASNPCQNGGRCRNELNGFRCECPYIYWGLQCELTAKGFEEGSFMVFSSLDVYQTDSSFDITFATTMPNGLLLYNPSTDKNTKDFMALEIINSYVRFSFNLGDAVSTKLTVKKNVTTGNWFRIQIQRSKENANMKVHDCLASGGECVTCQDFDAGCYAQGSQNTNVLNLGGHNLLIGGIDDDQTLLNSNGQIRTHDFVGCVRQLIVNSEDKLTSTPIRQNKISQTCPRIEQSSQCTPGFCQNGGQCVEEWNVVFCRCPAKFGGDRCETELQPLGFGPGAYVTFSQRENYRRDQLVSGSSRKRRSTQGSSVMVRFRSTSERGLLLVTSNTTDQGVLWINQGQLTFSVVKGTNSIQELSLQGGNAVDGSWHNATVLIQDGEITLQLNEEKVSKTNTNQFDFSDVAMTTMTLGGAESAVNVNGISVKDFDGCISIFEMNRLPISLWNSTTERFKVIRSAKTPNTGCAQLCSPNSCGGNQNCQPEGEAIVCSPLKNTPEDESLSIGVIVVIAFFGVLLIGIGIVFVVFRMRRQRKLGKSDHNKNTKFEGNGHLNTGYTNSNSPSGPNSDYRSPDSIHYNNRPDLINQPSRSPLPYVVDSSTVIIENGDMALNSLHDDMPEHYDIDNASSIAPSDIDIVSHYRDFRKGPNFKNDLTYHQRPHKHSSSSRTSRESPNSQNWNSNQPPYGALKQQTAPHMRHVQSNKLEVPSHVVTNSARNSPNYLGVRNSPINQLSRQSPQVRASPLTHSNVRGAVHHNRTSSDHSLASHHSRSSTSSSVPRAPLPNGHLKHHRELYKPPHKGLTKEEIDKLNARPQPASPSMMEAVSSSTEGHHLHRHNIHQSEQMMLVPPDSSSDDDSANDSFTCSEFEYENDKGGRCDFDTSAMIFSKLSEVENETDDSRLSPQKIVNSDGLDSNGGSFASTVGSSEGSQQTEGKPLNGQLGWDYLLNWGPSFEKLVGVFQDIASLPEGEPPEGETTNENREEYV